jgi:hypothetical protein
MPHSLKGLYGVAYSCSTNCNKYCDDWFQTKYKNVYKDSNTRSVKEVKKLGFNHIRTYYLKPEEDHSDFLQLCSDLNITIEIGISNDLIESRNTALIAKLVNSTKIYKCVKIYTAGNEYFGNLENVAFCLSYIYSLDNSKYIMHSTIFDDKFKTAKDVFRILNNGTNTGIKENYIVSINMYFYNNSPMSHGDVLQNVLREYYMDEELKNTYLIVSEFGNYKNEEQWNSFWNFNFGMVECLKKYNKFLGYCLFSFTDESWKGEHLGENKYGIITENGEKKQGYYAIEQFKNTDAYKQYIRK